MSEHKCGVRVIGVGVDSFYTVESEDDISAVVMLMRKAAQLTPRPEGTALTSREGRRLETLRARRDHLIARLQGPEAPYMTDWRKELSAVEWAHNKICDLCHANGLKVIPYTRSPQPGRSSIFCPSCKAYPCLTTCPSPNAAECVPTKEKS